MKSERLPEPDRRGDTVTADIVDIGLLFARVFGKHRAENFFRCTVVKPHVYQRVLLGVARRTHKRSGDGDIFLAE